jgi:hypothetical protein
MKAVIHQPQYFPYPGFFHKLTEADIFVILDNTQYDQRFSNRNKILTSTGVSWITVPIDKHQHFKLNKDVEIFNLPWKEKHLKSILYSYSKSKFFDNYFEFFKKFYEKEWKFLIDLNITSLIKIIEFLGIKINIMRESEINVKGKSTERLVNICKNIGADTYISGKGLPGKKYMDEEMFEKNGIRLEFNNYKPVAYDQNFTDEFVPNLSIIDMLFNVGPDSLKLIKNSKYIN